MCFVLSVAVASPAPVPARSASARLLALLVALLVLAVQPRAFAASLPCMGSGPHVVTNHAPRAESHALRVEVALRVAPAPVLGRVPCPAPEPGVRRWPSWRLAAVRALPARAPLGQRLSHFHSQRRIPRMNSDEPPRP